MSRVLPTSPRPCGTQASRHSGTGSRRARAEMAALLRVPSPPSVPHGWYGLEGPRTVPRGHCTAHGDLCTTHGDFA